ncbi:MAG: methyltransferase domain-containing protein [Holophagaceae bacterium]|nr:methyltransferase domain-containing protein [Holophagaceae bacterium]
MAYTSFFRDTDALNAIGEHVIPAISHSRVMRVWDAGCASGEEPYTLAILFASKLGAFHFRNLDILATDYEESNYAQFADKIRAAEYSRQDIFWVPQVHREQYFEATENPEVFRLTPPIRERVRYIQHDLLTLEPPETGYSLIVCKNVLMHFSPADQVKVLEMFHQTLLPGGFLAVDGNQAIPPAFATRFLQIERGTPLYQKPEA